MLYKNMLCSCSCGFGILAALVDPFIYITVVAKDFLG